MWQYRTGAMQSVSRAHECHYVANANERKHESGFDLSIKLKSIADNLCDSLMWLQRDVRVVQRHTKWEICRTCHILAR